MLQFLFQNVWKIWIIPPRDLPGRKIHVRQQMQDGRLCVLKDKESRIVPLATSLAPILEAWKLKTGGVGNCSSPQT
jgi:integrase